MLGPDLEATETAGPGMDGYRPRRNDLGSGFYPNHTCGTVFPTWQSVLSMVNLLGGSERDTIVYFEEGLHVLKYHQSKINNNN